MHQEAQPIIIHRDSKGSNMPLDEDFELKVANFGLSKFAPKGVTHVGTKVTGTMGYVALEYADSCQREVMFIVLALLLELLSRKKVFIIKNDEQHTLMAYWARGMMRSGKVLEVIEEGFHKQEI